MGPKAWKTAEGGLRRDGVLEHSRGGNLGGLWVRHRALDTIPRYSPRKKKLIN